MKNLRPDTKLYIRERDVDPIEELISTGKQYERVNRKCKEKTPPDVAQTFVQETAYKSHIEKSSCGIKPHLNTATVVTITEQRESVTVKKGNSGQKSLEDHTTLGKVCSLGSYISPLQTPEEIILSCMWEIR
jgi:hypothetical protein